jgi:hypothetical protein
MDVSAGAGGLVNVAALEAWVVAGGGTQHGLLTVVYNAVDNAYASIASASDATSARVVISGAAVLGDTGYLAASFDGTADPNTGDACYQRADSLGLTGAPALTLAGDLGAGLRGYSVFGGIGDLSSPAAGKAFQILGYLENDAAWFYFEPGMGSGSFREGYTSPASPGLPSWCQYAIGAGGALSTATARLGGASLALTAGSGTSQVLNLDDVGFGWSGTATTAGALSAPHSAYFLWNANLPAIPAAQSIFDAWMSTHHA